MAKFPYRGVVLTVYGGMSYKRAETIKDAENKAHDQYNELEKAGYPIAKAYVSDTKGNLIKDLTNIRGVKMARYNDGFAKMELQTIATAFDNGTMTVSTAKSRVFGYLGIDIKDRTKKGFLKELANYVYSEPKQNPAPKRKTSARTQSAAESYVRRKSQATGKSPTKRLVNRRIKNLQAPEGVFPNPASRVKTYKVETLNSTTGKWRRVATFEKLADAKEYANAYARQKTICAVRVVD